MKLHCLKDQKAFGYTTFGCMWKKGECQPETTYVCRTAEGSEVPMQTRITAYWPDGSVKWTAHTADAELLGKEMEVLPGTPASYEGMKLTEDAEGERLFEKVLRKSSEWATDEQMMYVVGATQGKMFLDIRKHVPNHFLVVPGVGAQGGSLAEVAKYGMNDQCGLIVNSSRAIIYADKSEAFAERAAEAAKAVQQEMAIYLSEKGII